MARRYVHPSTFMFLIVPFGALGGYLSVALAFLYARSGVTVAQIAGVVALGVLPHTWKFLWAPLVDTTLTRRTWYLFGAVLSAAGLFLTGTLPIRASSVAALSMIVLLSNVAVTFLGMATESLMAYTTREEEKGRAGGWLQAGNLGGTGVGGGLGLWMAQHLQASWMAGAVLAALCLLCGLALFAVPEPESARTAHGVVPALREVGRDLLGVARSARGSIALFLCFLPLGSGAASGLWSAVASDWRASPGTVALVTGVLGGVLSAVGCLLGGWICDRFDRKAAYAAFGVLQALCAIAMALAPRTEITYIVFTSLYAVIMGLTYAGFSAFVLEAMGLGAAATKYNVFASLSNTPIWYMTLVDGWSHNRYGPAGMLLTEAAFGVAGLVLYVVAATALARARAAAPAAATLPEEA